MSWEKERPVPTAPIRVSAVLTGKSQAMSTDV